MKNLKMEQDKSLSVREGEKDGTGCLFFYGAARSAGIAQHAKRLSNVEKVASGTISLPFPAK